MALVLAIVLVVRVVLVLVVLVVVVVRVVLEVLVVLVALVALVVLVVLVRTSSTRSSHGATTSQYYSTTSIPTSGGRLGRVPARHVGITWTFIDSRCMFFPNVF